MSLESSKAQPAASRRDVLKATGASALGVASFFAAANAIGEASAGAVVLGDRLTHIPTRMILRISGKPLGQLHSIGPATFAASVVRVTNNLGKLQWSRANSQAAAVTLTRYFDGDTTFRTWYAGIGGGAGAQASADRRHASALVIGRTGSMVSRLVLTDAWPSVWQTSEWHLGSTSAVHAMETVTLVAETITVT